MRTVRFLLLLLFLGRVLVSGRRSCCLLGRAGEGEGWVSVLFAGGTLGDNMRAHPPYDHLAVDHRALACAQKPGDRLRTVHTTTGSGCICAPSGPTHSTPRMGVESLRSEDVCGMVAPRYPHPPFRAS